MIFLARFGVRFPTRRFSGFLRVGRFGAGEGGFSSSTFRVRLVSPAGRFFVGVRIERGAMARFSPGVL